MSQAINDLNVYAQDHDLDVFEGHKECALQSQADEASLEDQCGGEMEAMACYPDHTVFQTCAFVVNGKLCRFGYESLDEDPADVIPVTLSELDALGDPRDLY